MPPDPVLPDQNTCGVLAHVAVSIWSKGVRPPRGLPSPSLARSRGRPGGAGARFPAEQDRTVGIQQGPAWTRNSGQARKGQAMGGCDHRGARALDIAPGPWPRGPGHAASPRRHPGRPPAPRAGAGFRRAPTAAQISGSLALVRSILDDQCRHLQNHGFHKGVDVSHATSTTPVTLPGRSCRPGSPRAGGEVPRESPAN